MDQESTSEATTEGVEPAGAEGQEPVTEAKGKTFDEAYVKQLRREAASTRTELAAASAELTKLRDRDKSESERMTERVAESERRAGAAELRLARYEAIAEYKLDLDLADLVAGETKDEIAANAAKLAEKFAQLRSDPTNSKSSGFDGGARKTPAATKPPEQAHNDLLLRAMGRSPSESD